MEHLIIIYYHQAVYYYNTSFILWFVHSSEYDTSKIDWFSFVRSSTCIIRTWIWIACNDQMLSDQLNYNLGEVLGWRFNESLQNWESMIRFEWLPVSSNWWLFEFESSFNLWMETLQKWCNTKIYFEMDEKCNSPIWRIVQQCNAFPTLNRGYWCDLCYF